MVCSGGSSSAGLQARACTARLAVKSTIYIYSTTKARLMGVVQQRRHLDRARMCVRRAGTERDVVCYGGSSSAGVRARTCQQSSFERAPANRALGSCPGVLCSAPERTCCVFLIITLSVACF